MTARSCKSIGFCAAVLAAPSLFAVDFVRGDANDDGIVTFSDGHAILQYLFITGKGISCGDAADVNDDGLLQLTDAVQLLRFAVHLGSPPPAPFPDPGPDPRGDATDPPCDAYGLGKPLEDPAASLRILDAVVAGGDDRRGTLILGISNSERVAGYYAELDAGGIISPTQLTKDSPGDGLYDLTGTLTAGFAGVTTDPATGRLRIWFLSSLVGDIAIPPRPSQAVLEVHVCLEPGTTAGAHSLNLVNGELTDFASGRRIVPGLVSGTLTVLEDIPASDCSIEPSRPERRDLLDIVFELKEATGAPGSEVNVPFYLKTSDQASTRGVNLSVDFDESVLTMLGVETVLPRPDGEPWPLEETWFENGDATGDNGIAEGYLAGQYVYGDTAPDEPRFPIDEEFQVFNLRFRVRPDAAPQVTEVRFQDGARFCPSRWPCVTFPWSNQILAGSAELSPGFVNSFVLVNGLVNIVPDVTVFIRGDSNGDGRVDLSDAQTTLGFLFLGGRRPYCFDAADANDDGKLDVSDPIDTLGYLFLGSQPLPPPSGEAGEDPTPDGMTCSSL